MFISEQYRSLSEDYGALAGLTDSATEISNFRNLQRSALTLAENEEWLSENYERTLHPIDPATMNSSEFAAEEELVLRCLGAALLMQWHQIPTTTQRELFDNAGAMGELQNTASLRGQIARFLHRYKDGARVDNGNLRTSNPDRCAVARWERRAGSGFWYFLGGFFRPPLPPNLKPTCQGSRQSSAGGAAAVRAWSSVGQE